MAKTLDIVRALRKKRGERDKETEDSNTLNIVRELRKKRAQREAPPESVAAAVVPEPVVQPAPAPKPLSEVGVSMVREQQEAFGGPPEVATQPEPRPDFMDANPLKALLEAAPEREFPGAMTKAERRKYHLRGAEVGGEGLGETELSTPSKILEGLPKMDPGENYEAYSKRIRKLNPQRSDQLKLYEKESTKLLDRVVLDAVRSASRRGETKIDDISTFVEKNFADLIAKGMNEKERTVVRNLATALADNMLKSGLGTAVEAGYFTTALSAPRELPDGRKVNIGKFSKKQQQAYLRAANAYKSMDKEDRSLAGQFLEGATRGTARAKRAFETVGGLAEKGAEEQISFRDTLSPEGLRKALQRKSAAPGVDPLTRHQLEGQGISAVQSGDPLGIAGQVGEMVPFAASAATGPASLPLITAQELPDIMVKLHEAKVDPVIAGPAAAIIAVGKSMVEKAQWETAVGGPKIAKKFIDALPNAAIRVLARQFGSGVVQTGEEVFQEIFEAAGIDGAKALDPNVLTPDLRMALDSYWENGLQVAQESFGPMMVYGLMGLPGNVQSSTGIQSQAQAPAIPDFQALQFERGQGPILGPSVEQQQVADLEAQISAVPGEGLEVDEGLAKVRELQKQKEAIAPTPLPADTAVRAIDKATDRAEARAEERGDELPPKTADRALKRASLRRDQEVFEKERARKAPLKKKVRAALEAKSKASEEQQEAEFKRVSGKAQRETKKAFEAEERKIEGEEIDKTLTEAVKKGKARTREVSEALVSDLERTARDESIPRKFREEASRLADRQRADLRSKAELDSRVEEAKKRREPAAISEPAVEEVKGLEKSTAKIAKGAAKTVDKAFAVEKKALDEREAAKKKPPLEKPVAVPPVEAAKPKKVEKTKTPLSQARSVAGKAQRLRKKLQKQIDDAPASERPALRQRLEVAKSAEKAAKQKLAPLAKEDRAAKKKADLEKRIKAVEAMETPTPDVQKEAIAISEADSAQEADLKPIQEGKTKPTASEKAKQELSDAWSEFGKVARSRGLAANPVFDPDMVIAASKVVAKAIKYGVTKFADVVAKATKGITSKESRDTITKHLAREWNSAKAKFGLKIDDAPDDDASDAVAKYRRLIQQKATPEMKAKVKSVEVPKKTVEKEKKLKASAMEEVKSKHGDKFSVKTGKRPSLQKKTAQSIKQNDAYRFLVTDNADIKTRADHIWGRNSNTSKTIVESARKAEQKKAEIIAKGVSELKQGLADAGLKTDADFEAFSSATKRGKKPSRQISVGLTNGELTGSPAELTRILQYSGDKHYRDALKLDGHAFEDGRPLLLDDADFGIIRDALERRYPNIQKLIGAIGKTNSGYLADEIDASLGASSGKKLKRRKDYVPGARQQAAVTAKKKQAASSEMREAMWLADMERVFEGKESKGRSLPSSFKQMPERDIQDASFIQNRTGHGIPVAGGDIIQAQLSHITKAANYAAWSETVRDMETLTTDMDVSEAVSNGVADGKYMMDQMLNDVRSAANLESGEVDSADKVASKIVKNLGRFGIGGRPHLALYQLVSMLYAAPKVGFKNALKASLVMPNGAKIKEARAEIAKHSPTLDARISGTGSRLVSLGQTEGTKENIRSQLGMDKSAKDKLAYGGMHFFDTAVIERIWIASKAQAKQDGVSDADLMAETNKRAVETVNESQPDWGVTSTSILQREARKSPLKKLLVMFSSQTGRVANTAMQALDAVRNKEISPKRFIAEIAPSMIFGPIAIEAIKTGTFMGYDFIAETILGKDDEEKYKRTWKKAIADTAVKAFGGFIAPAKILDAVNTAVDAVLSDRGSFGRTPRSNMLTQLGTDSYRVLEGVIRGLDSALDEEKSFDYSRLTRNVINVLGSAFGLPIGGLEQFFRPFIKKALKPLGQVDPAVKRRVRKRKARESRLKRRSLR